MSYSEEILEKIGLSPQEIKIYLTGLKIGPALASDIAKRAKIGRTLTYHIIESLGRKGLVNKTDSKNRKHFVMENPSRLKNILERKRKELGKLEEQLDSVSAELESIYTPKSFPSKISFYQGKEGLKNMMMDILQKEDHEMLAFTSIETMDNAFDKEFMDYWLEEMAKKNIHRRSIWNKPVAETRYSQSKNRELRIAPKDFFIDSTIVMYNNKVAVISSSDEPFAFVAEDKNFYNTMKSAFEETWKISTPSE